MNNETQLYPIQCVYSTAIYIAVHCISLSTYCTHPLHVAVVDATRPELRGMRAIARGTDRHTHVSVYRGEAIAQPSPRVVVFALTTLRSALAFMRDRRNETLMNSVH